MAIAVALRRKPAYTTPLHHIKNIVGCRRLSFVAKKSFISRAPLTLPATDSYQIAFTINKAAFDHEGRAVGVAALWGYF